MPERDLRRAAAREDMRQPPRGHATDILSISIQRNFINLASDGLLHVCPIEQVLNP
ncbi:UNVERIFIED_ORG: hypothetical protein J2791_004888 [Burkholderia contaminans]|nr:hypothetical protein [Burkholderia contaminans]